MTSAEPSTPPSVVAVLMTVHNRVDLTLRCLDALARQDAAVRLVPYVMDDGSTDGTGARVAQAHPGAVLLQGDGSLFWNRGMHAAFAAAMVSRPDYYLWVNDDTELSGDAVRRLLAVDAQRRDQTPMSPAVIVGAIADPSDGVVVYSGVRRHPRRRLRFDLVLPGTGPRPADTMNGNCVLLPSAVVARVGNLDPAFGHSMGDFDYGLRARQAGCDVVVAPGVVGTCRFNAGFVPRGGDVRAQWARLQDVRHLPPADWRHFARRWAGPLWPVWWLSPYLRRGAAIAWASVRSRVGTRGRGG